MEESLPLGVYRRNDTHRLYFELRVGKPKYYCSQIRSIQEGALCHDILLRYISQLKIGAPGGKRKALQELNYPKYSSTLVLDDLAQDFTEEKKKDVLMKAVLRQARAAAKAMPQEEHATRRPKLQKHCGQDVGDKSSSSKKDACSPSRGVKKRLDFAGDHTGSDCEKSMEDVFELVSQFSLEYKVKVSEREELERKVKDMTEESGYIWYKKPGTDKFHEHLARFQELVGSDGCKRCSWVEAFEQKYMSEEYKCIKLRKELEGHNMKSIPESLMRDGNTMTGFRREDERERLSPVLVIFPDTDVVSDFSAPLTSTPVLDVATPSTMEPVALGDKVANEDLDKFWSSLADGAGCRRENENALLEEEHSQEFQDWCNDLFASSQG